jgi:predicted permease
MIGFKTDGQLRDRGFRDLLGIARLKPGVTLPQARAEVAGLARQLGETYPDSNRSISATILPIWKAHFGPQGLLTAPLQILMAVCGILLLIVCANVTNLLLARMESRRREFTVQLALGARRGQLIRQMLTDSMLLAIAGTILGIVVAEFCGGMLRYLLPGGEGPSLQDLRPNLHVLGFAGLLCVVTALLSGVTSAVQFRQPNLNEGLKKEAGKATGGESSRLRNVLAVSEVSLALIALVGAGLFSRGFRAAQKINPGFNAGNVVFSQFYSTSSYNIADRLQFCLRLREKLESKPGVTAVAYSDAVPLGFQPSGWEELEIKGYVPDPGENMRTYRNVVSPGYFQLMQIPLLEGRDFTELDDKATAPVMIVNQAFVRHYFGQGLAIGRQVHGWGKWFTVVGVVKDSKYNYLTEGATPYFYIPFRQIYRADMTLALYVRSNIDPKQELATLRQAVREVDPKVAIFDTLPLATNLSASLFPQKVAATLLNGLGLLALLLTAIGLYSVMSYLVAQRLHEIGLRMALGAQHWNVLGWVLRRGMVLTLAGLLIGTFVAVVLSRGISHLSLPGLTMAGAGNLLGTSTADPTVYLGAAIFLCAVVTLANYIPARRATKIDPLVAIRHE